MLRIIYSEIFPHVMRVFCLGALSVEIPLFSFSLELYIMPSILNVVSKRGIHDRCSINLAIPNYRLLLVFPNLLLNSHYFYLYYPVSTHYDTYYLVQYLNLFLLFKSLVLIGPC